MNKLKNIFIFSLVLMLALILSLAVNTILFKTHIITVQELLVDTPIVKISDSTLASLNSIYPSTKEIPVCLGGSIDKDTIYITSLQQTTILNSTAYNVEYIQCPSYIGAEKVIATMHNHPVGTCRLSGEDISTYGDDLDRGQMLIGLSCNDGYMFWFMAKTKVQ